MSYLPISRKWAHNLAASHNLSEEKEEILAYSIELLVLNLANLVLTLLVGYLIGAFFETSLCVLTILVFRQIAGGAHSDSPWRCLLITVTILPLLGYIAKVLALKGQYFQDVLTIIVAILSFAMFYLFAPADTPKAPVSNKRKKFFKKVSFLVLAISLLAVYLLHFSSFVVKNNIQMSVTLALFWISFILSPLGYKLMSIVDMIDIKLKKEGKKL